MTATDELRRMLDERGVEWWNETDPEPQNVTMARAGGQLIAYHENANGSIGYYVCNTHDLTPEQAIAATLGAGTLTAERVMAIAGRHQPDYCSDTHVCFDWQAIADELNATLGDVPRLPHFWTHDGALHVELPKLPDSIQVRLPAQRDREVRSARTWQYTLDSGTCHAIVSDNLTESEGMGDAWADCSECGHLLFVLTDPNSEPPKFCPNCGRKVVTNG